VFIAANRVAVKKLRKIYDTGIFLKKIHCRFMEPMGLGWLHVPYVDYAMGTGSSFPRGKAAGVCS